MIEENDYVKGVDMYNNKIQGTVTNILINFGVAIVKTGIDRTNVNYCYIKDLEIIDKNE